MRQRHCYRQQYLSDAKNPNGYCGIGGTAWFVLSEQVSSPATPNVPPGDDGRREPTRWIIHGERVIDDTRRLRLSIAQVELPDGVRFEQYVLPMPKAAMTVVLDDARERVLMIWRHRFVPDCWTGELPGGYVDPDEDPAITAAREAELRRQVGTVEVRKPLRPVPILRCREGLLELTKGGRGGVVARGGNIGGSGCT